jgi:ubiquitin carboxyl-terminal hydrolase MINDY-1/2
LLQNENGPCPLLAAVNCLLLQNLIELTPLCKDHGFITLEDLTNLLALHAIQRNNDAVATATSSSPPEQQSQHTFHIDELMEHLPRFQFGMDVNPKFTGITAYEYTAELTAFDMLVGSSTLVHGWLAEPGSPYAVALGTMSYNQVLDQILHGQEAAVELARLQSLADGTKEGEVAPTDITAQIQEKQKLVELGHLCQDFLDESSHQLTLAGVASLLQHLDEDQPSVFFRNNHYGVITKHMGSLYLLVTDLGYAETADVVWERLDMVDGDTELCNAQFIVRKPISIPTSTTTSPETGVDADLQAALRLSLHEAGGGDSAAIGADGGGSPGPTAETSQELTDRMLAMQLQAGQAPTPAAGQDYQYYDDAMLAEELQRQENSRPLPTAHRPQQSPTARPGPIFNTSKGKDCCIM